MDFGYLEQVAISPSFVTEEQPTIHNFHFQSPFIMVNNHLPPGSCLILSLIFAFWWSTKSDEAAQETSLSMMAIHFTCCLFSTGAKDFRGLRRRWQNRLTATRSRGNTVENLKGTAGWTCDGYIWWVSWWSFDVLISLHPSHSINLFLSLSLSWCTSFLFNFLSPFVLSGDYL